MRAERTDIFNCEDGLQVEVLKGSNRADMACCGSDMNKLQEKTADAKTEKHVPVIEKVPGGYKVTVGSVPHPMVDDHWIEWIELIAGNRVYREYLEPGQAPEATFKLDANEVIAREHCNKHGLWRARN